MIDKAYTARELADLKLEGWPQTKAGIIKKADNENWPSRPRQASGGGREYAFNDLPVDLQKAIIFRLAEQNRALELTSSLSEMQLEEARGRSRFTAEERRSAKVTIVALFDKFQKSCGMGIVDAEEAFIAFYQTERAAQSCKVIPAWVYDIEPDFSLRSLRRWRSQARADVKTLGGRFGNRKGTSVIMRADGGKMADYIAALLLKQTHLTAGHVRDLCRARYGNSLTVKHQRTGAAEEVPMPKLRAFERHIATWKAENADIHAQLTNPDAHKSRRMMAIGQAASGVERINQVWEIDASPVDALCIDGRYALYAIIDVWSRRALFSITKTPRSEASLLLIRRAIMEWGAPETVKTDNGSDFVSKRFMMALLSLGIQQDICPPYSPEKKPHVERVIQTIQHGLMPLLPGFVGHNVADKQQLRAKETFAKSLGESEEKAFSVSLSHTDLQSIVDNWAADMYSHSEHKGIGGMTPFARAASSTAPIRRIENARALDLLLAPLADGDGFRTVGKKGLRVANGHFYGAGLELHVGKRVMVRHDPEDMGRVYVFTEDDVFICEATDFRRLGVNPAEAAAEAKARQRKAMTESTRELRREMKKITPEQIAEDYLGFHAREAAKVAAFPKQAEIYSTPSLDQAMRAVEDTSSRPMTAEETEQKETFVIDFKRHQEEAVKRPSAQSDAERWWDRAQALISKEAAGEILPDEDAAWLKNAKASAWFKVRRDFEAMKASAE